MRSAIEVLRGYHCEQIGFQIYQAEASWGKLHDYEKLSEPDSGTLTFDVEGMRHE